MNLKHVYGAVAVLAFGVVTVGPAYAQRRDGNLLPQEKGGDVTAVGCLVRGSAVRGGNKDQYALARPRKGPVASVPEATCTADAGADALDLDNTEKGGLSESMIGKWVQITGRLERETSKNPDDLRELDVASIRLVPVVPPKAAASPAPAAAPAPAAEAPRPAARAPEAPPAPAPTTSEPRTLPKTASDIPAVGLVGLLALAMGLMLRSFRLRRA
jgi:hypothetical protein